MNICTQLLENKFNMISVEHKDSLSGENLNKYRADIDGLRGIAVLAVVGFHVFPNWLKGGFIGVDIFFVISGYLISTIIFESLYQKTFSFIDFYSRRIRRIFPALLLVLTFNMLLGWYILMPEEYKQLGKHIAGGAGFVSNFVLWRESGYFDTAAEFKPLLHLWTLGIEEQYYIVWPLVLWFCWKKNIDMLIVAVSICLLSFIFNIYEMSVDRAGAFYSPLTRIWELMIGSVFAFIKIHKYDYECKFNYRYKSSSYKYGRAFLVMTKCKNSDNWKSFLGIFLLTICMIFVSKDSYFPGWWALLPTVGAVLIISSSPEVWINRNLLSNKILVQIGLISFPLYLWHWPLLAFLRIIGVEEPSVKQRMVLIIGSVLISILTYRIIEKPIRLRANFNFKNGILLSAMVFVGVFGYYCYRNDGVGAYQKFNLQMSEAEIVKERIKYWREGETNVNYNSHSPKIIIFGDSQAFDVFSSVKNNKEIGIKIYQTYYECSGFFSPSYGQELKKDQCQDLFGKFLNSSELAQADTLIYAHYWEKGREQVENYQVGIQLIKKINPKLKIYFFGPKPNLGNTYISINEIIKSHQTAYGMNEYLNSVKVIREEDTDYAKKISENVGAIFVDVNKIFCSNSCPFFVNNKFSYFDRNHWTEDGGKIFYENLMRDVTANEMFKP